MAALYDIRGQSNRLRPKEPRGETSEAESFQAALAFARAWQRAARPEATQGTPRVTTRSPTRTPFRCA